MAETPPAMPQATDERFRTLVEAAATIVWAVAPDGEIRAELPAWQAFTGQPPEDYLGWGWLDAVHPDDRSFTAKIWTEAVASRDPFRVEYRLRHHDGGYHRVLVRAVPILDAAGELREWLGMHIDMGSTAAASDDLAVFWDRYHILAELVPVHIWTAGTSGQLEYVSRRTADYFGIPQHELRGEVWTGAVHPADLDGFGQRWQQAIAEGGLFEAQYRLRRHDGTFRWFLARALPLRDVNGTVVRWFGTNTDIEMQKQAEIERDRALSEIRAERERFRQVLMQAPAAICITEGPAHLCTSANTVYVQVAGRNPVGKTVRQAFPEIDGQGLFELLDHVYASGEPYIGKEVRVELDRSGTGQLEPSYFDFVYQPLKNAAGATFGIMIHAVEVSDQVQVRAVIETANFEQRKLGLALERSNAELDQFAYVTSHDLKAPLRGIANLAGWIEEDLGEGISTEVADHLNLMRGRVTRMEALIDGILAYSRIGRVAGQVETIDLPALASDVVDLMAPGPHATISIDPDMPTIRSERLPLQQVLANLVGNAVKHSRGKQVEVRISAVVRDDMVELRVADTGPGIAPQFHERIFGIFQTLASRDDVEGSGLGLALVRKTIHHQGGRIWLESREGAGTTFFFTWPLTPKEV